MGKGAKDTQRITLPNGEVVDVDEVQQKLDAANAVMAAFFPYRFGVAAPHEFVSAEVNAHFMEKKMFDQLVANIERDGNLSSVPFCYWVDKTKPPRILSGHHRIEAAETAGVPLVPFLYVDRELTPAEMTAIQLSHNSIFGQDDMAVLRQQYMSINTVEMKLYSGLDDDHFKLYEPVNLGAFANQGLTVRVVELMFAPSEIEWLKENMSALQNGSREKFVGMAEQHADFKEALMSLKEGAQVFNTSTAFAVMVEAAVLYAQFIEDAEQMDRADWLELHNELVRRGKADPIFEAESD